MYNNWWDYIYTIDWISIISPGVSVLEKFIRAFIIYFVLIIGLRLSGKRELAQLSPFDIIVLFLLSNTVQNSLIGNDDSLTGGIVGALALFIINYIVIRFIYDNNKVATVLEGTSDVLIENGVIIYENLKKELISLPELEMAAHKQGYGELDEIERAEIDPDGALTFIAKKWEPNEEYQKELLLKIEELSNEIKQLKSSIQNTVKK